MRRRGGVGRGREPVLVGGPGDHAPGASRMDCRGSWVRATLAGRWVFRGCPARLGGAKHREEQECFVVVSAQARACVRAWSLLLMLRSAEIVLFPSLSLSLALFLFLSRFLSRFLSLALFLSPLPEMECISKRHGPSPPLPPFLVLHDGVV